MLHLPGVGQVTDFGIHVGQVLLQQFDVAGLVVDNQDALPHDASTESNAVTHWAASRAWVRNLVAPAPAAGRNPMPEVICLPVKPCITLFEAKHTRDLERLWAKPLERVNPISVGSFRYASGPRRRHEYRRRLSSVKHCQ